MGFGYEEALEFNTIVRSKARLEQKRQEYGVGVEMSALFADPRWKILADHVESRRKSLQDTITSLRGELNGKSFLPPDKYGQLKLDIASIEGMLDGIDYWGRVAKALLERGEAAAKEVAEE